MTNITKLRELLAADQDAWTDDNPARHEIVKLVPALLDRLEKLEAFVQDVREAKDDIPNNYALDAALAALETE